MADTNSPAYKTGLGGGFVSTQGMSAAQAQKTNADVTAGRKAGGH